MPVILMMLFVLMTGRAMDAEFQDVADQITADMDEAPVELEDVR